MATKKLHRGVIITFVALLTCAALALAGCAGSGSASASKSASSASSSANAASSASASKTTSAASGSYTSSVDASDPYGKGTHHAIVTVEGYDPFTIELNADEAPVTVSNFCKLANQGFYDGLNFYRFVDGFCMQGGSSNNSAAAANDGLTPIVDEFSQSGVQNKLADSFTKGTVAMARNSNPNSATSTFFVTLGSGSSVGASLNGMYAAFGTIDETGITTVDKIVADYLPNVTNKSMGAIADESKQAKITSIKIKD